MLVSISDVYVHEGGIPFAALIVSRDGQVLGKGVNRVRSDHDPTAHAEVVALRDACRNTAMPYLQGVILLASGEPCALCYMSALFAGVGEVLFAVDRHEAAANGFDYVSSYTLFADDPLQWRWPLVRKLAVPDGLRPFESFRLKAFSC